ncbi:unnamed protein product, partial [Vitis vinifera]
MHACFAYHVSIYSLDSPISISFTGVFFVPSFRSLISYYLLVSHDNSDVADNIHGLGTHIKCLASTLELQGSLNSSNLRYHSRDAVHEITRSNSVRLGGFVIDMFCTSMTDVADEFEVPSYLFFTSSAAFLGFMFHLQFLHDYEGLDFNEFKDSHAELEVPSYANPVPGKVFPSVMFDKEAILAHSAVGGFVSHCGWNSTLESMYYGVPVATWPMFAEQQINAFQMVKDLGLAVEIKMDYNKDSSYIVSAQEIEIGLKNLMNIDNEVRKKREEMKKISRKVMIEGGSSHFSLGHFIEDVIDQHSIIRISQVCSRSLYYLVKSLKGHKFNYVQIPLVKEYTID